MPLGARTSWTDNEDGCITPNGGVIDTSFLVEELRQKFQRCGEYVEVDFRSLVSWVRVGDQLSHQIHPYPAKLLPNIAHFFNRASVLQHEHHRVLDPFCGSGTVALEASLAGHIPYVADANPLALLITKVKTTAYDPEAIRQDLERVVSKAKRIRNAPEIPVVNQHLWYSNDKKKSLEILLRAILETTENSHKDFFLVAFSVIARRLSWADPAISVPVKLRTKDSFSDKRNEKIKSRLDWIADADTLGEYSKVCKTNIERIAECNNVRPNRINAVRIGHDARKLNSPILGDDTPLEAGSIPLIITSPPYGSAQKYIRATSLSLNWLRMAGPDGLSALEGCSIGREHLPQYRQQEIKDHLPDPYEELLLRIKKKNEMRARITQQYLHEMKSALSEMVRVTAKNGHVVIVIGNNMVCGEALRSDQFMVDILQAEGLSLEIGLIDHIKSRGLMTKRNKTASMISRESVLVFKK
jgi:DNA modification methylase